MDNEVSLSSINFTHILLYFISQYWSRLCTCPTTRVCPVSDQKTHCFQSYNQDYRNTGNK